MLVGVRGERLVEDHFGQTAIRHVVHAHPALFLDHLTLAEELVFAHLERPQPIRLKPQHQRQVLRRYGLPKNGGIFVGGRVCLPANTCDPRRMLVGPDVLGSLEHEVFKQVRKTCAAGLLVLGPDVIPHRQVNDGRRVIFKEHDLQPVGQRGHRVIKLGRPDDGVLGCRGQ